MLKHLRLRGEDEIIIVDTGSQDGTIAKAQEAGAILVINHESFNYSQTLNLGFQAAQNKWVLVLSAHCLPLNENFLESYRQALVELPEETAVVYGSNVFSISQYAKIDKNLKIHRPGTSIETLISGTNSNALYSHEIWRTHPFDESLQFGGEDFEWKHWAFKSGYICAEVPAACVYYQHRGSFLYRYRKACGDVAFLGFPRRPASWSYLIVGAIHASRHLLWERFEFQSWLGQLAHLLGVFISSRKRRS